MLKNTSFLTAGLLVLVGCGTPARDQGDPPAESSAPVGAVFELALWPGEGIPEFAATGVPLVLRSAPHPAASVYDTLIPAAAAPIGYLATSYQTITAARVTVLHHDSIAGRDFGTVTRLSREEYGDPSISQVVVAVDPATRLQLLQHRAEGSCLLSIDGRVIEATSCPSFDTESFAVSGEPLTRWWIYASIGPSAGWVEVTDYALRLTGRRF